MGSASDIHETGVWIQHGIVDVTLNFRRDHGQLTFNGLFQNNDDSATSLDNGSYWHFLFHCWTFLVECEDGRKLRWLIKAVALTLLGRGHMRGRLKWNPLSQPCSFFLPPQNNPGDLVCRHCVCYPAVVASRRRWTSVILTFLYLTTNMFRCHITHQRWGSAAVFPIDR